MVAYEKLTNKFPELKGSNIGVYLVRYIDDFTLNLTLSLKGRKIVEKINSTSKEESTEEVKKES